MWESTLETTGRQCNGGVEWRGRGGSRWIYVGDFYLGHFIFCKILAHIQIRWLKFKLMSAAGRSIWQLYCLSVLVSIKSTYSASVIYTYRWTSICSNVNLPPPQKIKKKSVFFSPLRERGGRIHYITKRNKRREVVGAGGGGGGRKRVRMWGVVGETKR